MENIEEATVESNGDVTIRYYYGKEVRIPKIVMEGKLVEEIKSELKFIEEFGNNKNEDWWKGRAIGLRIVLHLLGEKYYETFK